MLGKARDEMAGIETMIEHIVEEQQRLGHIVRQRSVHQLEIVVRVEHIEHGYRLLVSDGIAAEGDELVEYRQGITHASVGFLRHHIERLFARRHSFVRRYFLQISDGVRYRDAVEIIDLTTAEDSRKHFVLLCSRQDEDGV